MVMRPRIYHREEHMGPSPEDKKRRERIEEIKRQQIVLEEELCLANLTHESEALVLALQRTYEDLGKFVEERDGYGSATAVFVFEGGSANYSVLHPDKIKVLLQIYRTTTREELGLL